VSAALDDLHRALRTTVAASIHLLALEMRLDEKTASATAINTAEDRVFVAAAALTEAVRALPAERRRRIRGWVEPPLVNFAEDSP